MCLFDSEITGFEMTATFLLLHEIIFLKENNPAFFVVCLVLKNNLSEWRKMQNQRLVRSTPTDLLVKYIILHLYLKFHNTVPVFISENKAYINFSKG